MWRLSLIVLLALFSKVIIAEEADMSSLIKQADMLYQEGKFTAAKNSYLSALEEDNNNSEVLKKLATLILWENKPKEAVELYNRAYENSGWFSRRWPLSADLSYRMGSTYYRMNDFENAASWYERASGPVSAGPFKIMAAFARQMEAISKKPAYEFSGPEITSVKFVMTDPLPVVEVMVNGQGPYNFFIDTGGAELILTTDLVQELGVKIYSEFESSGFAGSKAATVGLGVIDQFQIGGMMIKNLPVHTLGFEGIEEVFDLPIHGTIGTRLFMQLYTTMDYVNGELILRRKNETTRKEIDRIANNAKLIPMWLIDMHQIMASGRLNNLEPNLFFVDTGLANAGFLASTEQFEKAGVEVDWSKSAVATGGGGELEETTVTIGRVSLGKGDNEVVKRNLGGKSHKNIVGVLRGELGFHVGGIISHTFFRDTALTFDFERMQLLILQ